VIGWSGIMEDSRGLVKNTKGSTMMHNHAAIFVSTWTIFFFTAYSLGNFSRFKAKRDNRDIDK